MVKVLISCFLLVNLQLTFEELGVGEKRWRNFLGMKFSLQERPILYNYYKEIRL
jgi:hypothetical protein